MMRGPTVICHWEKQNCSNEAAGNLEDGIAIGTPLCETEVVDHERSWYAYPDIDTLDRLHNCASIAISADKRRGRCLWSTDLEKNRAKSL